MKIIVAGGRNFKPTTHHLEYINSIHANINITEIVSGCADGADKFGEKWGKFNKIPIKRFPSNWRDVAGKPRHEIGYTRQGQRYWKLAGFARNTQMGVYADGVILFPGGNGTAHMKKEAQRLNIFIWEYHFTLI